MAHPLVLMALPAALCGGDVVSLATSPEAPLAATAPAAAAADSLAQFWAGGLSWEAFYDAVDRWVEQPVELQAIWLPIVARGTMAAEIDAKMTWYVEDAGREILREFVEVLEGASSGDVVCPGL